MSQGKDTLVAPPSLTRKPGGNVTTTMPDACSVFAIVTDTRTSVRMADPRNLGDTDLRVDGYTLIQKMNNGSLQAAACE